MFINKNRHNDTVLKKGNGKMMFTQGLTLNQFGEKYIYLNNYFILFLKKQFF